MGKPSETNATPQRPLRVPSPMWEAFGRVCERRGITRSARMLAMIRSDIRRYGDKQDRAGLAAADAELRERRSRRRPPAT